MESYITSQCIVDEYLSNWFTYQELADYLCIPLGDVQRVLSIASEVNPKIGSKIQRHHNHIEMYYDQLNKQVFINEENQIYVDIAEYMIEHKSSLSQTAHAFGLGKTTISDYVHERLPGISIVLYKQVFDVLNYNKSFSINNKCVIDQVLTSYSLLMQGMSSEEIANVQNIGRNVVQRNLTNRLRLIDEKKYAEAQEILSENRMAPLRKNSFSGK